MSFRSLERYESQKAAYDNYKAWKLLSPDAKQALYDAIPGIATGRAKPVLSAGFIIPFNATGTIVTYIETKKIIDATQGSAVGAAVATALRTALSGQFFATATGTTPVIISSPRYKFAKLSFTRRNTPVARVSRITKRSYKKPTSDTISMPFGGSSMSEDFDVAVAEIKTKASGANAWANASAGEIKQTYKFTPEGI
ncbi:hypothetical protein FJR11_02550 [Anabaena sp. UHCC 0187]|uniref:hypothetical protein n=1 Tax=Anabaena sp. UHCC 0187 TaxID=2590018 RepID=UPI001444C357|nr:hypothetical protein [Anabaena sp. UHCC 0187]MTJ11493.1 hypothetical protein [Anabaena sp. UHCC 0187]